MFQQGEFNNLNTENFANHLLGIRYLIHQKNGLKDKLISQTCFSYKTKTTRVTRFSNGTF